VTPGSAPELVLRGQWTPPARLVRALVASRSLVATLGRKNFFVQYRRASLGMAWAVGLPLVQAVVLAVVFSRIARFDVPHYVVFVLSGVVAFSFFQSTLVAGATSIVDNAGLSSKVYFPRAVLPLAQCVTGGYALAVSLAVLLVLGVVLGAPVGARTLLLVPAVALLVLLSTAFVLVLSVAHVYLRDTKYVVQAAALAWLWLTPVVYPLTVVEGWLRAVVVANPVTGVVQLFHAAFVPDVGPLTGAWVSLAWTLVLAAVGLYLHCAHDRVMADLL
jgi:ABC-type polysaccharide/polyol phosphate export permease